MRRADAEPLGKARIRLGHLWIPSFVATPYDCVNDFVYLLYDECMCDSGPNVMNNNVYDCQYD